MRFYNAIFLAVLFLICDCCQTSSKDVFNRQQLVSATLVYLEAHQFASYCANLDSIIQVPPELPDDKGIDSVEVNRVFELAIRRVQTHSLSCQVDYASQFQLFSNEKDKFAWIPGAVMKELGKDSALFANDLEDLIASSILRPLRIDELNERPTILRINPYHYERTKPFGDGMGVFSLSSPLFSEEGNNAILYYEFECGPKCGIGQVLFARLVNGVWTIVKSKPIYYS